MSVPPDLQVHILRFLGSTPWLLVAFVGAILCVVKASRAPKVCLLIGIALVLESLRIFLLPVVADVFVTAAMNSRPGMYSTQIYFVPSLLASIMSSVSLG